MSDNDKLTSLSDAEKKRQQKNLTKEAKLLDEITSLLESMDGRTFDYHLFLLLFTIFKESQADIRIKQYVNQLPLEQFDKFKGTVFAFNDFLHKFILVNMKAQGKGYITAESEAIMLETKAMIGNKIDDLVYKVNDYNIAVGETIFRFPDLEEARPSLFNKLKEKLKLGKEKMQK